MRTRLPGRSAPLPLALAIAVAGLLAPAPTSARRTPPSPAPPPAPAPAPAASAPAPIDPAAVQTLVNAADDITRQVVALRGLETRRAIPKGVLSREQIGRKILDKVESDFTPAELAVTARLLKRLGLIPQEMDYLQSLMAVLQEQAAGFYDPFSRQLYIADWLALEQQRPALAHELVHALQDQHFDLKPFSTPIKDDGDRQLARSALVEGDASVLMFEFGLRGRGLDLDRIPEEVFGSLISASGAAQSPLLGRAPRYLREQLLFPYVAGVQLALTLRRGRGWAGVDQAFAAPPESTEQVIHPAKYLAQEHPVAVVATPLASLAPRKELGRDVLGELALRLLFETRVADAPAEAAAAGWGGDRLVAYGTDDEAAPLVVVDRSAWDSEDDAREAEVALREVVGRGAKPLPDTGGAFVVEREGEAFAVERRGRELVALFGAPAEARAAVLDEVWKAWSATLPAAAVADAGAAAKPAVAARPAARPARASSSRSSSRSGKGKPASKGAGRAKK